MKKIWLQEYRLLNAFILVDVLASIFSRSCIMAITRGRGGGIFMVFDRHKRLAPKTMVAEYMYMYIRINIEIQSLWRILYDT